ncbi:MAG: DUF493 domain-containing protein [Gammaproteobacteria bacterium]|jgi:hypothetical protein|nr:DUF493 domain-containing protein [Gammaproteobacteria bacterium]
MDERDEDILEFPCDFPIKAMGLSRPGFRERVVEIVGNHVAFVSEHAVKSTSSATGKYTSVTVLITASSRVQLDRIYQELTDCEDVIMAL